MKRMIILTVGIIVSMVVNAQPARPGRPEMKGQPGVGVQRLEAMHVAYLTRELALSPEEAQQFWPVYNKYRNELKSSFDNTASNQDPLERQQKMLDIRKKYREEFSKSLGRDRANKVFNSTDHFRGMVKRAAENRKKSGNQQRPPQRMHQKRNWVPQDQPPF